MARVPYAVRYAALGAIFGLGSPLGLLLLLRYIKSFHPLIAEWLWAELASSAGLYLYTGVGTVLVFAALGGWAGRRTDALQRRTEALRDASDRLWRASTTDALTGLSSRAYLLDRLEQELKRARRHGTSLACLFIDVDRFKALNDRHGHLVGDRTLRDVAGVIRQKLRDTDVVGRYGGDEFLAVLPHARAPEARLAAERIRLGVEALTVGEDPAPVRATVSVGVVASVPTAASAPRYLESADEALRRGKAEGRNRVIVAELGNPAEPNGPASTPDAAGAGNREIHRRGAADPEPR